MNAPLAPPLDLLAVIDCMAEDLQTVDVCDRQAEGVTRWRLRIEDALLAAAAVEGASAGLDCTFWGSQTHRTWLLTSYSLICALEEQADQAARIEDDAKRAAAAAGAAAAAAEQTASDEYAAADDCKPGSEAEAHHLGAAAAAEAEAVTYRAAQAAAEERARLAAAWQEAATEAAEFGKTLVAQEDNVHRPIGEAIAKVGGLREVALEKRYHTVGG
jgi:hypothetical protein